MCKWHTIGRPLLAVHLRFRAEYLMLCVLRFAPESVRSASIPQTDYGLYTCASLPRLKGTETSSAACISRNADSGRQFQCAGNHVSRLTKRVMRKRGGPGVAAGRRRRRGLFPSFPPCKQHEACAHMPTDACLFGTRAILHSSHACESGCVRACMHARLHASIRLIYVCAYVVGVGATHP